MIHKVLFLRMSAGHFRMFDLRMPPLGGSAIVLERLT